MSKEKDNNNEKLKALKLTIDKIDKDYGKGSVMMMNERGEQTQEVVSTGSIGLDTALGIGGLPRGRVIEIYGPESSGKTTLAIHVIAEAQKKGGMCAIIDAEHAFDSAYAKKLGVDVDNLLISQPDYGEQGLEIADRLILSIPSVDRQPHFNFDVRIARRHHRHLDAAERARDVERGRTSRHDLRSGDPRRGHRETGEVLA